MKLSKLSYKLFEPISFLWLFMAFMLMYAIKPSFRLRIKSFKTGRSKVTYLRAMSKSHSNDHPYTIPFLILVLPLLFYVIPQIIIRILSPIIASVLTDRPVVFSYPEISFTGFFITSAVIFIFTLLIPLIFPVPSTLLNETN